jgi:hypothetical protein
MTGKIDKRTGNPWRDVVVAAIVTTFILGMSVPANAQSIGIDPLRPHPFSLTKALDDKPDGGEKPMTSPLNPPPTPGKDVGSTFSGGFNNDERPIHPLSSEDATCDSCTSCGNCCPPRPTWLQNSYLFLLFDCFQNQLEPVPFITHANFGNRLGGYTSVSLWDELGMSLEGGASAGWYDYRGSIFARGNSRFQNYWTAAFSQRILGDRVAWGFAHDWLYDQYFVNGIHLGQWRTKIAWQVNPCNQFGIWASIADRGATAMNAFGQQNSYRPISQGNIYWQREWHSSIMTQLLIGKAGPPGNWVFGSTANVPLTESIAIYANGNYILPRQEPPFAPGSAEMWNFTMGLQFSLGSAMRSNDLTNRPLFNLVDSSTMAIRGF